MKVKKAPAAIAWKRKSASSSKGNKRSSREPIAARTDPVQEQLLCLCKTPYDPDRYMIGCDSCPNWFHLDCIGISKERADSISRYFCRDCAIRKRSAEGANRSDSLPPAFLCSCKKPYDSNRYIIWCDECGKWFHLDCIGMSKVRADSVFRFYCSDCRVAGKGDEELLILCPCKMPYDSNRCMIGCDTCPNWFHLDCIGMSKERCDSLYHYSCQDCTGKEAIDTVEGELQDESQKPIEIECPSFHEDTGFASQIEIQAIEEGPQVGNPENV